MFDQFEAQAPLDKHSYETQALALRQQLLEIQFALEGSRHPVLIVLAGLDGAGKGVLVHRLNEWMDPRGIETNTYWERSDEEDNRPYFWRFWRQLPQRGQIGIFLGSWYTQVTQQRVEELIDDEALEAFCRRISEFERQLTDDGALVIKIWVHVSEETQRRQLEEKAPLRQQNPRVTENPYELVGKYQQAMITSKKVIQLTQTFQCPWHIVDGEDRNYREIKAGEIIRDAVLRRIETREPPAPREQFPPPVDALASVKLDSVLAKSAYRKKLLKYQSRLQDLAWEGYRQKRSLVAVFEGWDGAGKGSALRRVTGAIDPRLYKLVQISAPTDEELAHHYSWRFWRHLQRDGRVTLFDRSWYGRVMVERVEKFASEDEWTRAYREINEFERELTLHGSIVAKFWLHIDQDEQLTRFRAREQAAHKRHKITAEDWRNREKWPEYEAAVNEMIARTHTPHAPWTLVPGNNKHYARINILETLCEAMERALF
ncbi:polyphosphate:AMP phosphotransferase [Seongchinamella sediminis]|uniref:Polyphosphate:AMP phosphotransferase n=1 Tax=Seongchinamella sediminis TaxID=2283635 RepID=A0A3L7DZ31_9GAMM|nr:polyphosphate:AMP phosphotransferase [Seongchinamella sediminis]RLQ22858.1 polyphosphate:AMP phosphotransferase [Seongchinamella sediminis]